MRITELFNIQSIALDSAAADQAQIIDELVELQATHGNLTDKAAYKAAIYAREAEASTYVDNGKMCIRDRGIGLTSAVLVWPHRTGQHIHYSINSVPQFTAQNSAQ